MSDPGVHAGRMLGNTSDVSEAVREAVAQRTPLRVQGQATWMDAGRRVTASRVLRIDGLTGVVDYVPGDLTLTVRAGTTLREIERVTAAERQWLALDPFGSRDSSIGATVATDSSGPMAAAFGSPRDAVLGVEVVTGRGAVVRGGGRVVKNVAGFDLCRLFTGAWGTLAVVTEVTLRLHALPETTATFALQAESSTLRKTLDAVRATPGEPMAMQLVSSSVARALGLAARQTVLVRLAGNEDALRAQRARLSKTGELTALDEGVWDALRGIEPQAGAAVLRVSRAPARLPEVWQRTLQATGGVDGAMFSACVARGIVRCILPLNGEQHDAAGSDAGTVSTAIGALAASGDVVIGERLRHSEWRHISRPSVSDALSRRVKQTFDPERVLNPGILGDGS